MPETIKAKKIISNDDVLKDIEEVKRHGFGKVDIVIVNGAIKKCDATKTKIAE